MRKRLTNLGVTLAALAALAVGGSALASASDSTAPSKPAAVVGQAESESAAESSAEPDGDAAAQAAACAKAGIDTNADNVQYDDQTGTCSLDGDGNSDD